MLVFTWYLNPQAGLNITKSIVDTRDLTTEFRYFQYSRIPRHTDIGDGRGGEKRRGGMYQDREADRKLKNACSEEQAASMTLCTQVHWVRTKHDLFVPKPGRLSVANQPALPKC